MSIPLGAIVVLLVAAAAFLYTRPRHSPLLPTLPFAYPDSRAEALEVLRLAEGRTPEEEAFFRATDASVAPAFGRLLPGVPPEELERTMVAANPCIAALKYLINRPRPWQVRPEIRLRLLGSGTAATPSFPSGHSYQAFYLAKAYAKKFPALRAELYALAERCGEARVLAGHHYPSDHAFARALVARLH